MLFFTKGISDILLICICVVSSQRNSFMWYQSNGPEICISEQCFSLSPCLHLFIYAITNTTTKQKNKKTKREKEDLEQNRCLISVGFYLLSLNFS